VIKILFTSSNNLARKSRYDESREYILYLCSRLGYPTMPRPLNCADSMIHISLSIFLSTTTARVSVEAVPSRCEEKFPYSRWRHIGQALPSCWLQSVMHPRPEGMAAVWSRLFVNGFQVYWTLILVLHMPTPSCCRSASLLPSKSRPSCRLGPEYNEEAKSQVVTWSAA
jgi:hypothetical protein